MDGLVFLSRGAIGWSPTAPRMIIEHAHFIGCISSSSHDVGHKASEARLFGTRLGRRCWGRLGKEVNLGNRRRLDRDHLIVNDRLSLLFALKEIHF